MKESLIRWCKTWILHLILIEFHLYILNEVIAIDYKLKSYLMILI